MIHVLSSFGHSKDVWWLTNPYYPLFNNVNNIVTIYRHFYSIIRYQSTIYIYFSSNVKKRTQIFSINVTLYIIQVQTFPLKHYFTIKN